MPEDLVRLLFIILVVGQGYACMKSRRVGVFYYLCVGCLEYFSFWLGMTWAPDRVCGLVIIASGALRCEVRTFSWPGRDRFLLLFGYGLLITAVGIFQWPADPGSLDAYGRFRGVLQILNWTILCGVAYEVALVLADTPFTPELARRFITIPAIVLCTYALYQALAFAYGWPLTGIRRPVASITGDGSGEEFAAFMLGREAIYRPNSFLGEPKGLAAVCNWWIAFIGSTMIGRRAGVLSSVAFSLCLVALFLSGSTSAWAGGVLAVGSIFWVAVCVGSIKLRNGLIQFVVLGILGLGAGTYIVGSTVPDADLVRLIQDRSVARIQSEGILGDPAEQAALNVLRSNPMLLAFGSGLGGMSFYIKELGVLHSEFVLEPNTGVLRWVGSFGLVGLVVLGLSVARGASVLRSAVSCGGPDSVITLAVVGLAVVGQCLVFGTSFLWSVGLGSLAAAEASWFRYWAGTATASMGHSHRSLGLTDPSAPKQCEY